MPFAAGYVDLHCHILPGIDDGCQTIEQTLDVVSAWLAAGFHGAVCTPHVCTTLYPENHPAQIQAMVEALRQQLQEARLPFEIWAGGELRLAGRTIDWLKQRGVPTLGEGRAVLVDWWGCDWPGCCDQTIDYLLAEGFQPILAHPERMGLEICELMPILERLLDRGVLLQGNLNSIGGGEGPLAQQVADHLLGEGAYYVLASDSHGPDSVPGRQKGLARVRQMLGDALAQTLLADRPRELLSLA